MLTVTDPSSQSVGSGPIKNIKRSITDPISVLIPDSRGRVKTMANEKTKIAQNSQDIWGLSSISKYKKDVLYYIWSFQEYYINIFLHIGGQTIVFLLLKRRRCISTMHVFFQIILCAKNLTIWRIWFTKIFKLLHLLYSIVSKTSTIICKRAIAMQIIIIYHYWKKKLYSITIKSFLKLLDAY